MRKSERAFSLLELLLASAILAASLLAITRAFSLSIKTVRYSESMSREIMKADDKLQELGFAAASGVTFPGDADAAGNACESFPLGNGLNRISCPVREGGRGGDFDLRTFVR